MSAFFVVPQPDEEEQELDDPEWNYFVTFLCWHHTPEMGDVDTAYAIWREKQ